MISVESLVASCFSLLILLISVLSLSFLMSLAKDLSITPRSGAEAGRTPCPRGGSQEELPHIRGQGQRPRVPDSYGAGTVEVAERSYPTPEARGRGLEDQPHLQGAVAARAQEGLEELFYLQGQNGRR